MAATRNLYSVIAANRIIVTNSDGEERDAFGVELMLHTPDRLNVTRPYRKGVFSDSMPMAYGMIDAWVGNEDAIKAGEKAPIAQKVECDADVVMVEPHYRFWYDSDGNVVLDKTRVIRQIRVLAFVGVETIEGVTAQYIRRIPESAYLDADVEDVDDHGVDNTPPTGNPQQGANNGAGAAAQPQGNRNGQQQRVRR